MFAMGFVAKSKGETPKEIDLSITENPNHIRTVNTTITVIYSLLAIEYVLFHFWET